MTDTITKQEPKLSVRKPGVWRNVWRLPRQFSFIDGSKRGPGDVVGPSNWPSREIAEEKAKWWIKEVGAKERGIVYLGAAHFPEGDDQ